MQNDLIAINYRADRNNILYYICIFDVLKTFKLFLWQLWSIKINLLLDVVATVVDRCGVYGWWEVAVIIIGVTPAVLCVVVCAGGWGVVCVVVCAGGCVVVCAGGWGVVCGVVCAGGCVVVCGVVAGWIVVTTGPAIFPINNQSLKCNI